MGPTGGGGARGGGRTGGYGGGVYVGGDFGENIDFEGLFGSIFGGGRGGRGPTPGAD
jgi:hypothetical protein